MNKQHNSAMHVTHVKKYQRNSRRRQSVKKIRTISAVTSIGSFVPETIENTKELNWNNNDSIKLETNDTSVSSKSHQTKINRSPTTISIVRVPRSQPLALTIDQSHDQQQTIPNDIQAVLHHNRQKPCCSKIISDQVFKHNAPSVTRIYPRQTSISLCDFHPINAKNLSRNSSKSKANSHSTKQTTSDGSLFDKNEKNGPRQSYLTNPTKDKHRRRRRRRFCLCCSPCCCLLTGLLLSLLLAVLATLVTLLTVSKTTTTTTTTTTTSVITSTTTSTTTTTTSTTTTSTSTSTSTSTTSTSVTTITTTTTTTAATTVTITSNACTSSWNGVSLFNFCTNCPDINSYQQYAYTYVAIATQTRITFTFREDVGYFALDDTSVRSTSAPTVELLTNGGFETGTLSPWIYCNPSNSSYPGTLKTTSDNFYAQGKTYAAHGGNYYYLDGAVGNADYLSQMFATNIGQTYNISFWLYNQGSGSNSNANIIVSI